MLEINSDKNCKRTVHRHLQTSGIAGMQAKITAWKR